MLEVIIQHSTPAPYRNTKPPRPTRFMPELCSISSLQHSQYLRYLATSRMIPLYQEQLIKNNRMKDRRSIEPNAIQIPVKIDEQNSFLLITLGCLLIFFGGPLRQYKIWAKVMFSILFGALTLLVPRTPQSGSR